MRDFSTAFLCIYIKKKKKILHIYFTVNFWKQKNYIGSTLAIYADLCRITTFYFFANDILDYDSSYPTFYRLSASRDDPRK